MAEISGSGKLVKMLMMPPFVLLVSVFPYSARPTLEVVMSDPQKLKVALMVGAALYSMAG